MRQLASAALVLVVLSGSSARLLAARPTFQILDYSGAAFTLNGVCAFDVYEEPTGNKEKIATFYDQGGVVTMQIITGVNKWRLTNTSSGKFVDINGSGPGHFTAQPGTDYVYFEGGGVSFLYMVNPPTGIPTYALTKGRIVAVLDPNTFQVLQLIKQNGNVQDICAMLQ